MLIYSSKKPLLPWPLMDKPPFVCFRSSQLEGWALDSEAAASRSPSTKNQPSRHPRKRETRPLPKVARSDGRRVSQISVVSREERENQASQSRIGVDETHSHTVQSTHEAMFAVSHMTWDECSRVGTLALSVVSRMNVTTFSRSHACLLRNFFLH